MSDIKIHVSKAAETLGERYHSGLVSLYSLPAALESIVLRVAAPDGGEPTEGEKYIVEFRSADSDSVIEELEEDETRRFYLDSIRNVMDELAEEYLLSIAGDWENYVQQSGRCLPGDGGPTVHERANIERLVIRGR
jgi:hypothetical protein